MTWFKRPKGSYMSAWRNFSSRKICLCIKHLAQIKIILKDCNEYTSKHWLSLSTPILSFGKANHGLPISCYLSWIEDTKEGLIDTLSEVNRLSMLGGGVGGGCRNKNIR